MKAAVLYGQEKIRVEEMSPPALKPGEVRIRIEAALTCGTDLKVFNHGAFGKGGKSEPPIFIDAILALQNPPRGVHSGKSVIRPCILE